MDSGLGEVFVAIKGAMIVLGTYYVQTPQITTEPILGGLVAGALSSTVLFVNSFPDYDADKSHGRKTLVILLGRTRAASVAWIFPAISHGIIVTAVALHIFPPVSLITLATIPIAIKSCSGLKQKFDKVEEMVPVMKNFVTHSRITGALMVAGFVIDYFLRSFQ